MALHIIKKNLKRSVTVSLILSLVILTGYVTYEGSVVYAASANTNVVVTLQVDTGISITADSATKVMSNSLGVSSHTAVATSTFTVATNNAIGYTLALNASTNPAMKSGSNYVSDYATTTNPSTWSVASGDARFGFSAFGNDVNTTTWGTGSFCNGAATSTISTTLKYYGFYTNATTTATRASTTTPSGVTTTVCYAVQQNNTYIPSGTYTATITGTATTL